MHKSGTKGYMKNLKKYCHILWNLFGLVLSEYLIFSLGESLSAGGSFSWRSRWHIEQVKARTSKCTAVQQLQSSGSPEMAICGEILIGSKSVFLILPEVDKKCAGIHCKVNHDIHQNCL